MVQTLEAIKGGGGSIKVGTTGTIGALVSRELDPKKIPPRAPASSKSKVPVPTFCSFIAGSATSPKRVKPATSSDKASSSSQTQISRKSPEIVRKTKQYNRKTHQVPILESDNVSVDGTPIKPRRGLNMVEIVDIHCGRVEKTWAGPIKNQLKKLGFSKLSESTV